MNEFMILQVNRHDMCYYFSTVAKCCYLIERVTNVRFVIFCFEFLRYLIFDVDIEILTNLDLNHVRFI